MNEQLLNNLEIEFGIIHAGPATVDLILERTRAGDTFLFYHWTPSWLITKNNFTRVQLPQHDWKQWDDEASEYPDGPIGTC